MTTARVGGAARRLMAAALVFGVMQLTACGECPADGTSVRSDTREPLADGTRAFAHQGATSLIFDGAVARLKELDQGQKRGYCGQRLAAEGDVSDARIVADLSKQLGAGWRAVEEVRASQPAIKIYRWQSECSKRFYALIANQTALRAAEGQDFRPLVTLYGCSG